MTFKEFTKENKYTRVCKGVFLKDNNITSRKELYKKYKKRSQTFNVL
jgi:hypothetical protein